MPAQYDNNEYELLARLETSITLINENCNDPEYVKGEIDRLEYDARLLETYTFHIPRNTETFEIAKILREDVAEMKEQYDSGRASVTYCDIKTKLIKEKLDTALDVVAEKPRGE